MNIIIVGRNNVDQDCNILMFVSFNQSESAQALQNQLSQLQNCLLRLNLLFLQSPSFNPPPSISHQCTEILDNLQASIIKFCHQYEQKFNNLQDKLSLFTLPQRPKRQCETDEKYQVILNKIKQLQERLVRTQQNESKLIQAINSMMGKYHIYEQPAVIQNDQYLRSRIQTSQVSSRITFHPNINIRQLSLQKPSTPTPNLFKTIKRSQSNIYLYRQGASQEINHNPANRQFIRTFSKPNNINKISLRQVETTQRNPYGRSNSKERRHNSLDRDEHRLKFMMNKLND